MTPAQAVLFLAVCIAAGFVVPLLVALVWGAVA
ncbi:hypothetical protein UFOVP747_45 [uncultured Caudovirales phage]|uniref:Uncharacterized protein n=1 Tax=uncultured Caudovirales phage TaxID=2100421 RepID=A0A6J5NGT7_9CAUD|nr:hypothetical protein UFOVP675_54 [uncultured Caudovirales phage]CAB5225546.1 hypothetical protein UFOVP747_45 [uncultured Caudovirales phage]